MKRRTAVAKINSLPIATEEELTKHDDVCAICYMEMTNAKVTRCRHFFHSVCLRKWLYMQDTCPLCHAVLYKEQSEKAKKAAAVAAGGAPNAAADTNDNNSDSSPEVRIKPNKQESQPKKLPELTKKSPKKVLRSLFVW